MARRERLWCHSNRPWRQQPMRNQLTPHCLDDVAGRRSSAMTSVADLTARRRVLLTWFPALSKPNVDIDTDEDDTRRQAEELSKVPKSLRHLLGPLTPAAQDRWYYQYCEHKAAAANKGAEALMRALPAGTRIMSYLRRYHAPVRVVAQAWQRFLAVWVIYARSAEDGGSDKAVARARRPPRRSEVDYDAPMSLAGVLLVLQVLFPQQCRPAGRVLPQEELQEIVWHAQLFFHDEHAQGRRRVQEVQAWFAHVFAFYGQTRAEQHAQRLSGSYATECLRYFNPQTSRSSASSFLRSVSFGLFADV
eukprot:gene14359-10258_t